MIMPLIGIRSFQMSDLKPSETMIGKIIYGSSGTSRMLPDWMCSWSLSGPVYDNIKLFEFVLKLLLILIRSYNWESILNPY